VVEGSCLPVTGRTNTVLDTPASFGLDVPDDVRCAHSPAAARCARAAGVVGATRPIAGRLAALGRTGSLRSHPLAGGRV